MNVRKTPLYGVHSQSGAKMIEFGGWMMPVQYTGIIEEHRAVRQAAGLFDVSHMGEIKIAGEQAERLVNYLVTNDVSRMAVNQILYSPMCYSDGGVVDDLLVYKLGHNEFLLVVNAANIEKDYEWITQNAAGFEADINNISDGMAELALQGPRAESILQTLTGQDLSRIRYFWMDQSVDIGGITCLVSRTGYTGEDGFEIYCVPEQAAALWEKIMSAGRPQGLVPVGLGARDTLRFEAGLPLYGHELSESISPLEAGLGIFVKLDKENFIGKKALAQQKAGGLKRQIAGAEMIGRGIARAGYKCYAGGREIGTVTSGSFSPTLEKNLALVLVGAEYARPGAKIEVAVRDKMIEAALVTKPFYKRGKK